MTMRLLEGTVEPDDTAAIRKEMADLRSEVATVTLELHKERQKTVQMTRGVAELRRQLTPLYRALQALFMELDTTGVEDTPPAAGANYGTSTGPLPSDARVKAVWDSWKSRLGDGCAKVIDALQLHGPMNTQQLAVVTGYHRTTIPTYIYKLNKAGLLNKTGGLFSLKQI